MQVVSTNIYDSRSQNWENLIHLKFLSTSLHVNIMTYFYENDYIFQNKKISGKSTIVFHFCNSL